MRRATTAPVEKHPALVQTKFLRLFHAVPLGHHRRLAGLLGRRLGPLPDAPRRHGGIPPQRDHSQGAPLGRLAAAEKKAAASSLELGGSFLNRPRLFGDPVDAVAGEGAPPWPQLPRSVVLPDLERTNRHVLQHHFNDAGAGRVWRRWWHVRRRWRIERSHRILHTLCVHSTATCTSATPG